MRIPAFLLIAGLTLAHSVATQASVDIAACTAPAEPVDPSEIIARCTGLLQQGGLSDAQMAEVLNARGVAHDDAGDYDKAIADYGKAVDLKPDYAEAFNNRGVSYDNAENPEQAILDYGRAIALDPGYAEAYGNRAGSYEWLGNLDAALADIDRAIELDPEIPQFFSNRGNVYSSLRDYDRAVADYDRAIAMKPDYANAFNGRGNAHLYGKGAYEAAIADFTKALELNPDQHNARWARGVALFALGRYEQAETSLAEHVARNPDEPYGMLLLYVARRHQDRDASAALERQAADLSSGNWPVPLVNVYLGRHSASELEMYIEAVPNRTLPLRCEAAFYLGEIELLSGQVERARQRFQTAVEICPEDYPERIGAKAELGRL